MALVVDGVVLIPTGAQSLNMMRESAVRMIGGLMYLHELVQPWLITIAAGALIITLGSIALRGTSAELPMRRIATIMVGVGIISGSGLIAGMLVGSAGGINVLDTGP